METTIYKKFNLKTIVKIEKMNKMGKEYKCKDAGIDCEAVLYGETEEKLWSKIVEHAKDVHNMAEIDEDLAQKVRSLIRDV